jgi:hypothetical protein
VSAYGCLPDGHDPRDLRFAAPVPGDDFVVPLTHDLTPWFPEALNQFQHSTCTAHGVTAALRYNLIDNGRPDVVLSRSQPYWDSGVIEGDTSDVGRQIRDAVKAVAQKGVVPESVWPYDRIGEQPPPEVYAAASHRALEYRRVDCDRDSINAALFVGHPVIIGVPVFRDFESEETAQTGRVRMPRAGQTPVGLHCMLLGAYFPAWDKVLNSWSASWGDGGYCWLPRGYIETLGSDLWTITESN